jgi:hypothetical protein
LIAGGIAQTYEKNLSINLSGILFLTVFPPLLIHNALKCIIKNKCLWERIICKSKIHFIWSVVFRVKTTVLNFISINLNFIKK